MPINFHMRNLKRSSSLYFKPIIPVIFIFIIISGFFWKVFLLKQVPFPGDFVAGVYFPWLDYKWGYPTGVPVKNPITADVPSFIYPMQTFAISILKDHQLPLWNPLILTGTPLLANFQSAPFSPVNILYFLTNNLTAWSLEIILAHFFAALFTYILLRSWKVSKIGSIIGGVIFAFSGFNLIWSQWNGHTLSAAFIPLILFFESKYLKTPRFRYGLGFLLSIFIQILAGYPQIVLYTVLAGGIYYLLNIFSLKRKDILTKTFFLSLFGILAIGLSSFQIFPGKELLQSSQRQVELHPYEWAFLPWTKTITFIAVDFFGNHATGNYWGPQDYTSNTGYVGVVAFILALFAVLFIKKNKNILYVFLLALASLFLAYPTFISIFLWKSGLLGLNAASAHRSLVLFCLAISLLAGFGTDVINKIKLKYFLIFTIPLILLSVFGLWAFHIKEMVGLKNLILPSSMLATTFLIFIFVYKFNKFYFLGKVFLLAAILVELFYFGWKFTPFSPGQLVFPTTPVLEFLQKQEKPFRVIADKVIPINFLMNYGIETLEGYDAVYPIGISQYIAAVNGGQEDTNSIRRYAIVDNYFESLEDLANVKYFLVLSKDINKYLKDKKFKVAFIDKSVTVLENLKVLPRARIENGNVYYLKYSSQESILKVDAKEPNTLHISDTFYPGWKAYIDNIPTQIYKVDSVFRGINIPKGEHIIKMVYEPESFYTGLKISLISLIFLLGLSLAYKLYFRKFV